MINEVYFHAESDDQQCDTENDLGTVTAIIKVKDVPGALWKAIHTIGVRVNSNYFLMIMPTKKKLHPQP